MSRAKLEQRMTELEKQVSDLVADRAAQRRAKDWRRTRGAFTGDDLMKKVFEEGARIRKSQGNKTRRAATKKKQAAAS